jgi:hypothetical protein
VQGARKVKVTLSLSSKALKGLDQRRGRKLSRSAAIEADIEESNKAARQRALEEEVRAYYAAGDPEGEAISEATGRIVKTMNFDDDVPKRKRR